MRPTPARARALPAAPVRAPDRVLLSSPLAAALRPAAGARARGGGGGAGRRSAWLAADGSKRWGEAFFLLYTPFWLTLCLGIIVPFKLYEVLLLVDLRLHALFGLVIDSWLIGRILDPIYWISDVARRLGCRVLGVEWVSG